MRIIVTFIVILCFKLSFSQTYLPYLADTKQWGYVYDGVFSAYGQRYVLYYLDGDTVINSTTYKKQYGKIQCIEISQGVYPEDCNVPYLAALLREDINEKKVYYYCGLPFFNDFNIYNTEQVLYDFSLELGDSLKRYVFGFPDFLDSIYYKIDRIETHTVDGKDIRSLYSNNIKITEGIGSDEIIPDKEWTGYVSIWQSRILCVRDNEGILDTDCDNCFRFNHVNTFKDLLVIDFSCDNKEIKIAIEIANAKLIIYDNIGQIVKKTDLEKGNNYIDVTDIKSGIYLYSITADTLIRNGKFIIK